MKNINKIEMLYNSSQLEINQEIDIDLKQNLNNHAQVQNFQQINNFEIDFINLIPEKRKDISVAL